MQTPTVVPSLTPESERLLVLLVIEQLDQAGSSVRKERIRDLFGHALATGYLPQEDVPLVSAHDLYLILNRMESQGWIRVTEDGLQLLSTGHKAAEELRAQFSGHSPNWCEVVKDWDHSR